MKANLGHATGAYFDGKGATFSSEVPKSLPTDSSARMLLDLTTGKVLAAQNEANAVPPRHLSQLLLVTLVADRISKGKLCLDDAVTIRPVAPRVAGRGSVTGLPTGSKVSVSDLIRAISVCNARDSALSLAQHLCGTSGAALDEIRRLSAAIGMDGTVVTNISGRAAAGQRTTTRDIARLLRHFYERHPNRLHWFSASEATFADRLFRTSGNLVADGKASFAFSSGGNPRWGFAIGRTGDRLFLACAAGAHDAFNLDYRLDALLTQAEGGQSYPEQGARPAASAAQVRLSVGERDVYRINVLGDTYFGEWYSARRRRRGVEDSLARYGYDHSFDGIRELLAEGDYNIANFEAALSHHQEKGLAARKPFVLSGNPERSVAALRRAGVHAVSLGNNHAVDAGARGLVDTLQAFDKAGIARFGAGRNADEAEAPLNLRAGDRTYKFFSAYWYRRYMEHDCMFYALPRRGGVACISGGLLDLIRAEKDRDVPATVVVLAHWGSDYVWTSPAQRLLARRIVDAGADLVIGSGPHMLGEFESLDGRWILYSVGNGVFNSDGEYGRRGMPPYGFITRLHLAPDAAQLRLYPILTDNQKTFWQPRFVSSAEFDHVLAVLRERGISINCEFPGDAAWHTKDEADRPMIVLPVT